MDTLYTVNRGQDSLKGNQYLGLFISGAEGTFKVIKLYKEKIQRTKNYCCQFI